MHVGDMVLLLMVMIVAVLFVALFWLGREYYRMMEAQADGSRLKDLIEQESLASDIETAAERLWGRLREDSHELHAIAERIAALCRAQEDETRERPV